MMQEGTELKQTNPMAGLFEHANATKEAVPIGIAVKIDKKVETNVKAEGKEPTVSSESTGKSCYAKVSGVIDSLKASLKQDEENCSGLSKAHFIWEFRGHFNNQPGLLNKAFSKILFEHVLKDVTMAVFLFYYLFVALTTYRIYGGNHSPTFLANDMVKALVVDDEFSTEPPSSFLDVASGEEINMFAEFMAESLFTTDEFYSYDDFVEHGFGDYRTFNGVTRLDGVTVRAKLAEHPSTLSLEEDEMDHDYHGHSYVEHTGIHAVHGTLQEYSGSGYVHMFELEPTSTLSQNTEPRQQFLDFVHNFSNSGHTRFISFDFVLMSDHSKYDCIHPQDGGHAVNYEDCEIDYDLVSYMQLIFEIDQFQVVYPFMHQMSLDMKALDHMEKFTIVAVGASIVISVLLAITLLRQRLYFFFRAENYVTLGIVLSSIAIAVEFYSMKHHFDSWIDHDCAPAYDEDGHLRHVDHHCVYEMFNDLLEYVSTEQCLAALQVFMTIKVLGFLSIFVASFRVVGRTVKLSIHKMTMFAMFWLIVMICSSAIFTILFGHVLTEYNCLEATLFTLLRAVLGDIDFDIFASTEWHALGPWIVYAFAWAQVFIILTLYISIVDESYEEASGMIYVKYSLERIPFTGYGSLFSKDFLSMLCNCCQSAEGKHRRKSLIQATHEVDVHIVAAELKAAIHIQSHWRARALRAVWQSFIKGKGQQSKHDKMMVFFSKHFKEIEQRFDALEKSKA